MTYYGIMSPEGQFMADQGSSSAIPKLYQTRASAYRNGLAGWRERKGWRIVKVELAVAQEKAQER